MDKFLTSEVLPIKSVEIKDDFWGKYIDLVNEVVIPYQWEALNDRLPDAEPSYAIKNFRIAAGLEEGEFGGMVFQDSDLYKWLEAVAYSLETNPNPELMAIADEAIDLIEAAQGDDGYVNTYFTIKEPDKRWYNLCECHELYCLGHMIEAAVAYYNATGKRKFLDIACRFVDYVDTIFGPEPHKAKGYPGHQVIEMALVKLYDVTNNSKYLALSKYFIDQRGQEPNYFKEEYEKRDGVSHFLKTKIPLDLPYNQAHKPVREQEVAVGHAVRAVYMYSGMADIAAKTNDETLKKACETIFNNIKDKQMYITGGVGSTAHGEAFTYDYDLPNDTVYSETCAAIGLIFFAQRMLKLDQDRKYADVLERALYNTVTSGMALDGRHFFYVNPLEVQPEASEKSPIKRHVKAERQKWYGCACCPPNVARLLTSLGQYIYTESNDTIFTHLYIGSKADFTVNNKKVTVKQTTNYPSEGKATFVFDMSENNEFTFALRIPEWCKNYKIFINNEEYRELDLNKGYLYITREFLNSDVVEISMEIETVLVASNPLVRANAGKVAICRGPLVYCLEEIDNCKNLSSILIDTSKPVKEQYNPEVLGGAIELKASGYIVSSESQDLYTSFNVKEMPFNITAIPYFMWGNRGLGEMSVWIRYK
ncbi:glycoside hydrolase family 127 protein [Clostridium cellulovorans]|uniref:Glycoside hydrolase family 127 protein n=1 Tax=Clostridium cellulovorans (strain ATCC 35296 / DSM 3052 / OCM 3 / 743B) TaxID=573061 RepID=D9STN1_CLOC7|nr:beta-L-arabinofuranosidase domain-containing protein [Clostridium cellulovorans]ADL52765.1 protein of unknown function DUF1680 [Clostridium cellulovorans 743B]